MKKNIKTVLATLLLGVGLIWSNVATAQYNKAAGMNKITESVEEEYYDEVSRSTKKRLVEREVQGDSYGNAQGNQYDLAIDGAFEGQTIVVLHLYVDGQFTFDQPKAALAEKGFSVYRYINQPPDAEELKEALDKACQLWIISSSDQRLNNDHLKVIKDYFEAGHGVYIWGDNDPFYGDANFVAQALIGAKMNGNLMGDHAVTLQKDEKKIGIMPNHLITTGLQNVYEGITIATLDEHEDLEPILYGSAGNLVTAAYEKDGKRLILDGGFTRLYYKWDTAGTDRYVKNAAAWLVNYEKFGDSVVADDVKGE